MNKIKSVTSLKNFRSRLKKLPSLNNNSLLCARAREPNLIKPPGSLGRLEEIASWLSAWQGKHPPSLDFPRALVFAGNHGVAKQGVSAYSSDVTAQMVNNFNSGGAAINQLCKTFDVDLEVIPLNLNKPTRDITEAAALTENQFLKAINTGIESIKEKTDILCLGEMGIGNTTSAAALCNSVFGSSALSWTGLGTGVNKHVYQKKVHIVEKAVARHQPFIADGLDALIKLGGYELSAIAGAVFGARLLSIPVVLDGFISSSAAAMLESTHRGALDHCVVAHQSIENGHKKLLAKLNKTPLFDFGMRLGEASGSVLSIGLFKAAVNCHNGMSTFEEAGVTDKID